MDDKLYQCYLSILKEEMITALGCTEPIAIAYAAAKSRAVLGITPEKAVVWCSGNIVKNVKSVTVPNSGGMTGIEVAAILGIVGGNADDKLEVLSGITEEHRMKTKELLGTGFCTCKMRTGVDNLYVQVYLEGGGHSCAVTVMYRHTLIYEIIKDDVVVYQHDIIRKNATDKSFMSMDGILDFINCVRIEDLSDTIGREITTNSEISAEGLRNPYGAQIGRTVLKAYGNDVKFRAIAAAAAGSDARMSGCALPVMINSGSGNQGMTVSLPVLEYAKELGCTKEKTYQALALSNLVSIHIKKYIGDLSAFCGAVSAGCGAGAAITFLHGGTREQIGNTIINTLANVGGIICDGAKASCAAKIASSVNAAILAHELSMNGIVFGTGNGIVLNNVENTIKSIGYIGRNGMNETDLTILKIMLGEISF